MAFCCCLFFVVVVVVVVVLLIFLPTTYDPDIFCIRITKRKMKKFFDSRRDMVSSGLAFGVSGGGSGSGGGGSFIGRIFTVGRFQVTVEDVVAEGKLCNF